MRIGFDAKRAFSNYTGLGNYSRDTIRVLSTFFSENKYFLFTPEKTSNPRLEFLENHDNINIVSPNNLFNMLFSSLWRSKNLVNDIRNNRIDIYHGLSHELPIGIEKTNVKTVVTIHDLIYLRYPELFTKVDRKIFDKKFRSACDRADKIIAISKQTKKDIIDFFNIHEKKIEVVYQGCNEVFKSIKNASEIANVKNKFKLFENYLLYVGSIEKRKNLLTLLKSLKDLPNKNLIIIGDGKSYKKECLNFIKKNKLEKRTKILSGLNLFEMACIYQDAKMLIYPSIFEGFGIPIVEALFSKIPVITSKDSCFKEAGGEDSIYIDPLSSEEITKAINRIGNDENFKKNMIEKGYNFAQNFTDKKIANNLMRLYNSL